MIEFKNCFGISKAKGHGCGKSVKALTRIHGLCQTCYKDWLLNSKDGNEKLNKSILHAKKETNKVKCLETKQAKDRLKTRSDWESDLQKEINLIVRLIDKGHPCISSGRNLGKSYDAGHLMGRQSHPQIRYHLFNIFSQSVHDNQWKSGNQLEFVSGIEKTFGVEVKDYCLSLKGFEPLKLTIDEINEKISIAKGLVKWLKLQDRKFTVSERLELRVKFNKELNIYK